MQRKKIGMILGGLFAVVTCIFVIGKYHPSPQIFGAAKTYAEDTTIFPNPERGFFYQIYDYASNPNTLTKAQLQNQRAQNITLIRRVYILDTFKTSPISQTYLTNMQQDFQAAREAGVKLAIRFAYNYTSGGEDTELPQVLSHLDQLKPLLQDNQDVIAYQEAGFIGYWGEWHHSLHNLTDPNAEKQILIKELATLPQTRMIALRYSRDKRTIFANTAPLQSSEAFNASNRSRVGYHNDCFLADGTDSGTYKDPTMTVDQVRSFHHTENPYVVEGGETCANNTTYVSCQNALQDLAYLNFSTLNSGFQPDVLNGWNTGGCMNEIKRRLGYRFRVVQASVPDAVKPGGKFPVIIAITNDGWASPFNARLVELVLRNTQTKQEYTLRLPDDPRLWFAGQTKTITVDAGVSASVPVGQYTLFINLPDPLTTLYKKPEFSIRLANQNMWEATTGYNQLATVQIDAAAAGDMYQGANIFGQATVTSPSPVTTVASSPTSVQGNTTLHLKVLLHGIGNGGDNSNPTSGGNANPVHTTRTVTVQVFDAVNAPVFSSQGTITFNKSLGLFEGDVSSANITAGVYTVKVFLPQYLKKLVPGIVTISAGTTNTLPSVTLVTGDSNGDNVLSVLDYNIILDCFSDLAPAKNCSDPTKKQMADLNDDGAVNQLDYNLFLRELSVQNGEGNGATPTPPTPTTITTVTATPQPSGTQPSRFYYVATTGSDTNPGTTQQPFKTVAKALATVQPGEGIMIRAGTYTEKVKISGKNGTPQAPIYIVGEPTISSQYPVFDGGDTGYTGTDGPSFDISTSSWLTIERIKIINSTSASIRVLDSPYITVRRVIMDYHKYGVYAKGHSHHFLMEYTECYQSYGAQSWSQLKGSKWEGGCYWPSGNSGMDIIRYNYMHDQFNAVSMVNNGSTAGFVNANTWIYQNRFERIMDDPFEPETVAFNQHFFANTLVDTHRMVSIAPPASSAFLGPVYVYNNTMVTRFDITKESRHNTAVKADMTVFPANKFYFFNNSIDLSTSGLNGSGVDLLNSTLHNYIQYNNAFKTEINIFSGTPSLVASEVDYDVSSKPFNLTEAHGLGSTDPGFTNSNGENFALTTNSPAKGKARAVVLTTGFTNTTVIPQGADVGAYQNGQLRTSPMPQYVTPPGGEDPTFGPSNLPWPADIFPGTNPPHGPK